MLKKCLRPCPGLSMYLSRRIKWIISKTNREIWKILFVPESLHHVCILQAIIRDGILFSYNIRNFGSVNYLPNKDGKMNDSKNKSIFWRSSSLFWGFSRVKRCLEYNLHVVLMLKKYIPQKTRQSYDKFTQVCSYFLDFNH